MTTMDGSLSLLEIMAYRLGKRAEAKKEVKARKATQTVPWFISTVRIALHLAGFGSLTFAGFTWTITAGLVVGGLSCFAMSWLTTDNTTTTDEGPQRMMG